MGFLESVASTAGEIGSVMADQKECAPVADLGQMVTGTSELAGAAADGKVSMQGGTDLAGGAAKLFAHMADDVAGRVPFVDAAVGAMDAGIGVYGMSQTGDQKNQGILSNDSGDRNQYWGDAGNATLGAAHAGLGILEDAGVTADIGEACSVLGLPAEAASIPETVLSTSLDSALTIGQTAVDTVGTVSGLAGAAVNYEDGLKGANAYHTGFTAGDVVGAGEHLLYDGGVDVTGSISSAAKNLAASGAPPPSVVQTMPVDQSTPGDIYAD